MTQSRMYALGLILLFFVWGGISYYWYTCEIKGLCEEKTTTIHIGGHSLFSITHHNN